MRTSFSIVLIVGTLALAGCSADRLSKQADQFDTGADQIRMVVADIEQGRADHADLIAALDRYVPEAIRPEVNRVIDIADNTPDAGRQVADTLDRIASEFREQAARDASDVENAVFGIVSITEALIGTNGLLAGLAALFWKRKRDSDGITEDVVTSIESSEKLREAISSGAGSDLRKSQSAKTQKKVAEIKRAIKGNA